MKVYYFSTNFLVKRSITILLVSLALLLCLKIIQYNLFRPALSNLAPVYSGRSLKVNMHQANIYYLS